MLSSKSGSCSFAFRDVITTTEGPSCLDRHLFTLRKLLFSHNQLQFLKVKCGKVLTDMVQKKIAQVPGEGSFSTCRKRTKTTILPVRYLCNIKPDNTKKCDLPGCNISNPNQSWSILTGCFQSIHCKCLDESTSCPLCKDFLQKKVQEIGTAVTWVQIK